MNRDKIAKLISVILQPEIAILILLILTLIKTGELYIIEFSLCVFLLCIIQLISKRNFMKGSEQEDRKIPYIITILSCIICSTSMLLIDNSGYYLFISVSFLAGSIILALINIKIKVSVHSGVISLVAMTMALFFWPVGILFLSLIPIISWSRLYLGKHTKDQVLLGCFVGIIVTIVLYLMFIYESILIM